MYCFLFKNRTLLQKIVPTSFKKINSTENPIYKIIGIKTITLLRRISYDYSGFKLNSLKIYGSIVFF